MVRLVVVSCADSGELHTLTLSSDGRLTPHQVLRLGGMLMPMALHPSGHRLYVARRSEPLAVLSVGVSADGTLVLLGQAPVSVSLAYLSCDLTGRHWMGASYGSHCISIGTIDANGIAQAPTQQLSTGHQK